MKKRNSFFLSIIISFNIFTLQSISFAQDYSTWRIADMEKYGKQNKISSINYPGDSKFDVTFYKLDLIITHSPQYLVGAVTINAKADTQNVTSIFLDLASALTVDSVILNGNSTIFDHTGDTLNINLDGIYNQNDPFSLIVYYQGLPVASESGGLEFDSHNGVPLITTQSEPYGAKDWWPCKDTPADKADSSEVWITVDNNLTPVSNGSLIEIIGNGNGTHTYKWKENYPIAQYLISIAITNYVEYTNYYRYSPTDSMPITNFIYPETFNNLIKERLDKVPGIIGFFSYYFGQYPFINEKFGQAQWNGNGSASAMENQTIVFDLGIYLDGVNMHELTHQWFGDLITCKDWHHIWLNEGFASYLPFIWNEVKIGRPNYDAGMNAMMTLAKLAEGSIWVEDITDINEIFNISRSYDKGGIVLHMLRGVVGDSTFFDIIKAYASDPELAYGVATNEDFQGVAETVSGMDLDYFFQEWIYGENFPKYTINWGKTNLTGEIFQVDININQSINTNPSFFTMPVRIKINTSLGDTVVTIFNNSQNQDFQFEIVGNPNSINFDYGNWILDDVLSIIGVEDEFSPVNFSLSQNYPNPFNPNTTIKYEISEMSFVTLKVFDLLGKEVATLINEEKPMGNYEIKFDGSKLTSGIYFYQLQAGAFVETKKMILLK